MQGFECSEMYVPLKVQNGTRLTKIFFYMCIWTFLCLMAAWRSFVFTHNIAPLCQRSTDADGNNDRNESNFWVSFEWLYVTIDICWAQIFNTDIKTWSFPVFLNQNSDRQCWITTKYLFIIHRPPPKQQCFKKKNWVKFHKWHSNNNNNTALPMVT